MNSYLVPKLQALFVVNLRNSMLLRATDALIVNSLNHNLQHSDLTRASLIAEMKERMWSYCH